MNYPNSVRSLTLALAAAVAAGAPGSLAAQQPDEAHLRAFAAEVDSLRVAHRIPGLSMAVVRDGRVVMARGFGLADVEREIRATEHTPYDIASVTKPLAGVTAMRLAERGVLDLDRRMSTFREWDAFCAEARADGPPIFFADYDCSPHVTLRHMLSMQINGAAGERFFYNPISFSWASRPIMEAAGRPFSDLVAEEVFVPSGMTRSARMYRDLPLRADLAAALAKPYHVDSTGAFVRTVRDESHGDGAAGGVVSTVMDLARFDVALDDGRLLTEASKEEMWRPGRSSSGEVLPYGIGWFVQEVDGRRLVWHSGWWDDAYSALYLKLPDERMSLILLANSEGVWWDNPKDAAQVERSPFAAAFLRHFGG